MSLKYKKFQWNIQIIAHTNHPQLMSQLLVEVWCHCNEMTWINETINEGNFFGLEDIRFTGNLNFFQRLVVPLKRLDVI